MSSPPPRPPLARANQARRAATTYRAEWLVALAEDVVTLPDVLAHAATEEGRPLLRVRLHQLLTTQPGWGEVRAGRVLATLGEFLSEPGCATGRTLAWLLDPRAGGRRVTAFLEAYFARRRHETPWPGFPYAKAPPALQAPAPRRPR